MINKNLLAEIKEIMQSSNVNFLLGSGVSSPFLPILGGIENDINQAIEDGNLSKQITGYKTYLEKVMLPNVNIILENFTKHKNFEWDKDAGTWKERTEAEAKEAYSITLDSYNIFFTILAKLISERKTTILSKQVNIFTTNIDIFMETCLEKLHIDYNDGFSGRLSPSFLLSNYKKSIFQRSLHFDHKSEIPIFNIIKIHGSLTWKYNIDEEIILSSKIDHLDKLITKTGKTFVNEYKNKILVVNPENAKFSKTVLNTYFYELLRSYSSELERENSVLFVIGFSMADRHIREITQRAAKSNPTLKIFIFAHSKDRKEEMEQKMGIDKFQNIIIIAPEFDDGAQEYFYDLKTVAENLFKEVNFKKRDNGE